MANKQITYTDIDKQIEKLKLQHLEINDLSFAKEQLRQCGYSNLIKSYRDPYIVIENGNKIYRSSVSFEQIYSLYLLDKAIRNAVMAAMLDLEEHIKESTANVIAKAFGTHQDDYLNFRNYRDKSKRNTRFSLGNILEVMRKTLETEKNPIYHYKCNYNMVPPWILLKSVYFSTVVNFINYFKPKEKIEITKYLYDVNRLKLPFENLSKLMMDTLFMCLEYRNLAAHGGRTYNYTCNSKLRVTEIFTEQFNLSGFSQLMFLLHLFTYSAPHKTLSDTITNELNRHCTVYPQDITYLEQVLNIDIFKINEVYVSTRSKKYHQTPYCSGLLNAEIISLEDAIAGGYTPCKKCTE